jgi:hypothetical protein
MKAGPVREKLLQWGHRAPFKNSMARVAQSRNLRGLNWLTKKKVTYRRHVGKERQELKRQAFEERKERIALKELEAKERAADARIAAAQRKIETAARKTDTGGMSEAKFDAMKARMEKEIEKQEEFKAAALAKVNPSWGYGIYTGSGFTTDQVAHFKSKAAAETYARSQGLTGYRIRRSFAKDRNPCASTRKADVTDRAKRYRANQLGCKPAGAKKCKLCGSKSDVMVDHVDGNESNGRKSNLRWLCRSCNTVLGAEMARTGQGRRTVQYNPAHKGAQTLGEYMQAVLQHTRGAHDDGGRIIHDTPKRKREEFASEIWAARKARGNPTSTGRTSAGNPCGQHDRGLSRNTALEFSTEYHLGYNLGQADKQSARLRKTLDELHATFNANFAPGAIASWESFEQAYQAGYGGQMGAAAPNPKRGEPFQYKGVTITPVPPTFDRYDVALRTGTIRLTSIQDAKDWVTRQMSNPEAWTTVYKTRAAAQSAWYDSAPGRNDHATFKKVRGGWVIKVASRWNPGIPKLRTLLKRMTAEQQSELTRAIDRFYYAALDEGFKPSEAQSFAEKRSVPEAEKILKRNNPEPAGDGSEEYQQALRTAELFHGRPVKEQIEVEEKIRTHDWYVSIGPLIKLIIKPITKKPKKRVPLPFHQTEDGQVHLFCSPDGLQFYLRGGDQELDLDAFGMGEGSKWYRDHILIGEAVEITYRDKKKFNSFKLTDWYHKLGEETGDKPTLAYDSFAKKLSIIGGAYRIEMQDLVDGMSPGIVN